MKSPGHFYDMMTQGLANVNCEHTDNKDVFAGFGDKRKPEMTCAVSVGFSTLSACGAQD